MDFDISKLNGDWLKWAKEADEHKKGSKDKKINSAFEEAYILNAAFDAKKSVDDVKNIFGADFATKYENRLKNETADIDKKSDTAKSAQKDVINKYLAQSAQTYINKPDWKAFAETIKKQILSPDKELTNRGYYTELTKQIDEVANAMSTQRYNNREDIKDLYDKVKDGLQLDKNDPFKDFKLEVLKQMVMIAESHQMKIENDIIQAKYDELRKTMSREEAIEKIQKDDSLKGSYAHDYYGRDMNEVFAKKDTGYLHKGLIHKMEDSVLMKEAREEVYKAIEKQREIFAKKPIEELAKITGKDIDAAAKEYMGDNLDKYAKKVFRGELSFESKLKFERSNVKAHCHEIAADLRAMALAQKSFTDTEIRDELKNEQLFEGMLSAGLINKDDNGGYNITNLSNAIREKLGADLRANKQNKDFYSLAEIENVVKDIASKSGIPSEQVSSKDVKSLIKLCGFEVEGKNWAKIFINALVDTAVAGASAFVATELGMDNQAYDKVHDVEVELPVSTTVDLDISFIGSKGKVNIYKLVSDLKSKNYSDIQWSLTDDKLSLSFVKNELKKGKTDEPLEFYEEFSKRAGETALKTMLVAFALNLLKEALSDTGVEIPITSTQFTTTSVEEYTKNIDADKKLSPAQKEALKRLVDAFIERKDGKPVLNENGEPKWDAESFKGCLNRMAGDASVLNSHEFHIGVEREIKAQQEKLVKELAKVEPPVVEPKPKKEPEKVTLTASKEVTSITHKWTKEHSWQAVIATYYPEAYEQYKNNLKPLVDAFRKAHGISNKHGVPAGKDVVLRDITIGGKTYAAKADTDGARLKQFTSNEYFGWGAEYFNDPEALKKKNLGAPEVENKIKEKVTVKNESTGKEYSAESEETARNNAELDIIDGTVVTYKRKWGEEPDSTYTKNNM